jgi:hypothetical protein
MGIIGLFVGWVVGTGNHRSNIGVAANPAEQSLSGLP